jgi:chemotaxis protein histidine kinase CheA
MRERIESTGGHLVVETGLGSGTRLIARVPRTVDVGLRAATLEGAA